MPLSINKNWSIDNKEEHGENGDITGKSNQNAIAVNSTSSWESIGKGRHCQLI
jgi:hypothetical protein